MHRKRSSEMVLKITVDVICLEFIVFCWAASIIDTCISNAAHGYWKDEFNCDLCVRDLFEMRPCVCWRPQRVTLIYNCVWNHAALPSALRFWILNMEMEKMVLFCYHLLYLRRKKPTGRSERFLHCKRSLKIYWNCNKIN